MRHGKVSRGGVI